MPELPEVETIKRGLSKLIIKDKIKDTKILCEKSFDGKIREIKNAKITQIRRFGKALIIDLDNGKSLMIHLRMTGQLIYDGKKERYAAGHPSENFLDTLPNKQTRVIFELQNGFLYFNDQRKFGFIKVLDREAVESDPFIKKLAPEPWDMKPNDFYQKLQKHSAPVKSVILDQTIICGLGNIYADEALFKAQIHPETKANKLSLPQAETLLASAKYVMEKSIESGGSTLKDYKKPDGTRGDYLDKFAQVFSREGQPCPICGTKIKKIKVAGRGTHFCPYCQTPTGGCL